MRTRADIECWLTDMDGVLVHENRPIPGASELLAQWRDDGTPFLVLTNNPIFTPRDLSARLRAYLDVGPRDRRVPPLAAARWHRVRHRRSRSHDRAARGRVHHDRDAA
jgi:NagD protein